MSDSIKASLGRRIKTLRRENGLTQAKLALMINVEQSYLSKLELGSRNPSLSMLSKIADAFGITLSELFSGLPKDEGEPSSKNPRREDPPLKRPFLSPARLNRCRTCDFYASGTSPFRALATLRAAAVIVRSSTFTVTSAYFS